MNQIKFFFDPNLRFAQTVVVGDVKGVSSSCCVHSSCASFLQPQVVEDFGETWVLQSESHIRLCTRLGIQKQHSFGLFI